MLVNRLLKFPSLSDYLRYLQLRPNGDKNSDGTYWIYRFDDDVVLGSTIRADDPRLRKFYEPKHYGDFDDDVDFGPESKG